jgi:uncharacterized membrane protein YbaN (DUF454 family)
MHVRSLLVCIVLLNSSRGLALTYLPIGVIFPVLPASSCAPFLATPLLFFVHDSQHLRWKLSHFWSTLHG